MVKHARTKKRRAGRAGRSKLKNKNYQFFKPPQIKDATVMSAWNPRLSPAQNMARMGLQSSVNSAIDARAAISLARSGAPPPDSKKAVELFDIPASDKLDDDGGITHLPGKTFAQRKLPVSVEDQRYIQRCLARHGDDYRAMMRDIKTNDMQHTESRLRKMASRFFLLAEEQVRVEIPEKVRHLMTCCKDEEEEK